MSRKVLEITKTNSVDDSMNDVLYNCKLNINLFKIDPNYKPVWKIFGNSVKVYADNLNITEKHLESYKEILPNYNFNFKDEYIIHKIILFNVDKFVTEKDLVDHILNPNNQNKIKDEDKKEVFNVKKLGNSNNFLLLLPKRLRDIIIIENKRKLNIFDDKISVNDFFQQCINCHSMEHKTAFCKNKSICKRCSSETCENNKFCSPFCWKCYENNLDSDHVINSNYCTIGKKYQNDQTEKLNLLYEKNI